MAKKPITERLKERKEALQGLQAEVAKLEEEAGKRCARLAAQAGLAELDIPDADLLAAFKELAGRFRDKQAAATPKPPKDVPAKARPAAQTKPVAVDAGS